MRSSLFVLVALCHATVAFKLLVYLPAMGRSHVNFLGALADILVDQGHDVVALMPMYDTSIGSVGTKKARIIKVPQSEGARLYQEHNEQASGMISNVWKSTSILDMHSSLKEMGSSLADQCNYTLNHPNLLQQLKDEHFDVAFGEVMDLCGFGIFNVLGLENLVVAHSAGTFEKFAITGVPSFPSYVPGHMSATSDRMTFLERTKNAASAPVARVLLSHLLLGPIYDIFDRRYPHLPKGDDLTNNTSLIFINAEPLIDFPRITAHKIIEIGGITASSAHKPLNSTWSAILSLRPRTVLLSFGSLVKSHLMPEDYKQNIRNTFKKFPEVTFIWKYEKPEHKISEGIDNIIESTWVPQIDMLNDPRLSVFITHCGAGSTMEAMIAGKSLIVIPAMGDQIRNAQLVKRAGTGYVLEKADLGSISKLEEALREVLYDERYANAANRTAELIKHRPFEMKDVFIRNMEFVARFGPLTMLDHYGRQMSFISYYLLDVFAFFAILILTASVVSFFLIRLLVRFIFRSDTKKKVQ